MRTALLVGSFFLLTLTAFAQKKNAAFQLQMRKASSAIAIDGVMDEQAWNDAEVATHFYMALPMDTSYAKVRTDVRMTYEDKNLYLIALCYQAVPGPYYVESLRRDFVFGKNDNFLLFMDSFDDQTNGYSFGANAARSSPTIHPGRSSSPGTSSGAASSSRAAKKQLAMASRPWMKRSSSCRSSPRQTAPPWRARSGSGACGCLGRPSRRRRSATST